MGEADTYPQAPLVSPHPLQTPSAGSHLGGRPALLCAVAKPYLPLVMLLQKIPLFGDTSVHLGILPACPAQASSFFQAPAGKMTKLEPQQI